jgi:hypothetical protein
MVKLLIIIITLHTPQNRVSDTITHVRLNPIKKCTLNIILSVTYYWNHALLYLFTI